MAHVSEQLEELYRKFEQLMLKFSLEEVREHILTIFPDLTWDIVVKAINQFNLSARKEDIAKLLVEYLKNFPIQDARIVYGNLLVSDLMLHHKNKTWTVASMRQMNKLIDEDEYEKEIVKSFQKHGKTLNIYWKREDNKTWFTFIIYRKSKSGRISYQKPIFVAHPLNSKYLFFTPSPHRMNVETMKLIVAGFGYENYQIMKLTGRNILSLESMLDRKKDAEKIRAETARALKSLENEPVRSTMGLNFCRNEIRAEHAKQMFGDERVELQTLTVNFASEWRGVQTLPQAKGESFDFTMKLKSKNVGETLKLMVRNGALKEPYPEWAKDFLIAGKNEINVAE